MSKPRSALVLGGTGTVGRAVVQQLHAENVRCVFTYRAREAEATELAERVGGRAVRVDATDGDALIALAREAGPVDVFIHCAGTLDATPAVDLDTDAFDHSHTLNARSAFILCRELAPAMMDRGRGDILLVGGMDRAQSLPIPVAYAASQGTLAAMTMALAKELGGEGVNINMVALGLLDAGLSLGLSESLREDYVAYSALRRFGSATEVAPAIVWLALNNRYLNGKVIPINGGL